MHRIALFFLGLVFAINTAFVTSTKVVQCKTTYRGKLKEPGVADHRSLCTLTTNFMDNSDMCLTTDTRGDINGYYSVSDDWPALCVTFIYKEENVSLFINDVVLYRGVSQLKNAQTCEQVCTQLSSLINFVPEITIYYVGCVTSENGNDEDINKLDWNKPSPYTCNTSNNYAKPGDPGRPGPPSVQTTTSTTTTTTTSTTTTPTTTTQTTKTSPASSGPTASPKGNPSWMWPIIGALAGLLALMAVLLIVEIVASRQVFNAVSKIGDASGTDVPMY